MQGIEKALKYLKSKKAEELFKKLYGSNQTVLKNQIIRYEQALKSFSMKFPVDGVEIELFSTPGRTEVGGNHTDHNAGRVLAAAINLDAIAVVSPVNEQKIRVWSEGYPCIEINLDELSIVEDEKYTSAALVRGVCSRLRQLGYNIGGFNAYVTSDVLKGSGLSSSAAFEVLLVTILNHLYNDGKISDILNAQIAQYAENIYFGKPCGLMDQATCAVGGFITIDFNDFENPVVKKIDFDFEKSGYSLIIVDTGGSHDNLNEDYAAIENEMKAVAKALGYDVLRRTSKQEVLERIPFLRERVNDRAILRALHFFDDDLRVVKQAEALEKDKFTDFLRLINESGLSSWTLCQNCYSHSNIDEQGISVALCVTENILRDKGAWRVHGGGFAGTIQVFTPLDMVREYTDKMKSIFGENSCYELMVRPLGTTKLKVCL